MLLIPFGVVWIGYTLIWYGMTNIKGPGVGILDLIVPSRILATTGKLAGGSNSGPSGTPVAPAPPGSNPFFAPAPSTTTLI